jgi:DNA ligase (NAD+)
MTLIDLERWGEKKAQNLLDAIEKSKSQPFHRLIYALGIRHVGAGVAQVVGEHFPSVEALQRATEDELQKVSAIGPRIAESIVRFFSEKHNREIMRKLAGAGVSMAAPKKGQKTGKLAGKTFVLTGALSRYSREAARKAIEENGGTVASTVSKKVHYLVVGEEAGSKLAKARQLGITTLSEEQFIKMLQ